VSVAIVDKFGELVQFADFLHLMPPRKFIHRDAQNEEEKEKQKKQQMTIREEEEDHKKDR
jgi:hypothetical protein